MDMGGRSRSKQASGQYRDFVDALQRAEADSEAESVKTVVEAGKRNWKDCG